MRAIVSCAFLLALSACGDLGQSQHSILGDELPGLGDLDTITKEDKAEAAWWDRFYGQSSATPAPAATGGLGGTLITPMAAPHSDSGASAPASSASAPASSDSGASQ